MSKTLLIIANTPKNLRPSRRLSRSTIRYFSIRRYNFNITHTYTHTKRRCYVYVVENVSTCWIIPRVGLHREECQNVSPEGQHPLFHPLFRPLFLTDSFSDPLNHSSGVDWTAKSNPLPDERCELKKHSLRCEWEYEPRKFWFIILFHFSSGLRGREILFFLWMVWNRVLSKRIISFLWFIRNGRIQCKKTIKST